MAHPQGASLARDIGLRVGVPVDTALELADVPVLSRADGMMLALKTSDEIWIFDATSTASGAGVVTPTVGNGRWLLSNKNHSSAVANIAAMAALDDLSVADGTLLPMASLRDTWMLDKSATLAADGITVIVPLSGSGRWIRSGQSSLFWRSQDTWHIDQAAGNDENDGLTAGTAISSHEEFQRRIADADHPVAVTMTVTFDSDYSGNIENKAPASQLPPYGSILYQ